MGETRCLFPDCFAGFRLSIVVPAGFQFAQSFSVVVADEMDPVADVFTLHIWWPKLVFILFIESSCERASNSF